MTNWPRGGYAAGNTPASELKPPPPGMVSKETVPASEPTYTAAEVKVLTETATRLGRELGKAEAWEQIADEISLGDDWQVEDPRISYVDVQIDKDAYLRLEEIRTARSQPAGATSDASSGEDA